MANDKIILTQKGKEKLEQELIQLTTVERPEIKDRIKEAREYGDLSEIINLNKNANVISKIESMKGIDFVLRNNCYLNLMAARDDLFINSDCSYEIINYLKYIISKDKDAVCASRIFSSLCKTGKISLCDFEDLELMYLFGYRKFMLQDDVKGETLKLVLKGFGDFKRG